MLNEEQAAVKAQLEAFLQSPEQFFLLAGYAGTGKTYLLTQCLLERKVVFTAPTNKAVKILATGLREAVAASKNPSRTIPTCTIFSLLGLTLKADGAVKVLSQKEEDFSIRDFDIVVVDEASMVGTSLLPHLLKAVKGTKVKVIFSGDPMQLPPVKEARSEVWTMEMEMGKLQKVVRHDNAILSYATRLRALMNAPAPNLKPTQDFHDGEGIIVHKAPLLTVLAGTHENFEEPEKVKVIAWRNIMVDKYNAAIRRVLLEDADRELFLPSDRVILTEPALDLESESGRVLGTTDEEGVIVATGRTEIMGVECYELKIHFDGNRTETLTTPTAKGRVSWTRTKGIMAEQARLDPSFWKTFWEFHESFHYVRHAYAITAHRSQGSTYEKAFVDIHDILSNPNRKEAMRCLYVAATRARKELHFSERRTML